MYIVSSLSTAGLAYLLGSLPTGYLAGRVRGIDIRTVGSGNIGATNVFRILGTTAGIIVLIVDGLKGWLAVTEIPELIQRCLAPASGWNLEYLKIIAAVFVILGHNYTCWLKFKGGKGIATSAGVLAALMPVTFLISLSTWIVVCLVTRYVSVASIAAALILPLASWGAGYSLPLIFIANLLAALAVYKHLPNIGRLLNVNLRISWASKDRPALDRDNAMTATVLGAVGRPGEPRAGGQKCCIKAATTSPSGDIIPRTWKNYGQTGRTNLFCRDHPPARPGPSNLDFSRAVTGSGLSDRRNSFQGFREAMGRLAEFYRCGGERDQGLQQNTGPTMRGRRYPETAPIARVAASVRPDALPSKVASGGIPTGHRGRLATTRAGVGAAQQLSPSPGLSGLHQRRRLGWSWAARRKRDRHRGRSS